MMNTIAAGGVYHTPLFVECTVDETTGEELTPLAHGSSRRVFAEQTAEKLQELLAGVVAEGTGRQAAPSEGTAAGKTGTAQTGQFRDGEELKNYWFAGFLPGRKAPMDHRGDAGRPDRAGGVQRSRLCPPVATY